MLRRFPRFSLRTMTRDDSIHSIDSVQFDLLCRFLDRVASVGCPAKAPTRSGQGDCHHPALPLMRLAATCPSVGLVPLSSEVLLRGAPTSTHRASVPSEVPIHTGRLYSGGSRCLPIPYRPRSSAALQLPHHLRSRLRVPLRTTYLPAEASF